MLEFSYPSLRAPVTGFAGPVECQQGGAAVCLWSLILLKVILEKRLPFRQTDSHSEPLLRRILTFQPKSHHGVNVKICTKYTKSRSPG